MLIKSKDAYQSVLCLAVLDICSAARQNFH